MRKLAGIRFRKSGKIYSFLAEDIELKENDVVVVDTVNGNAIGYVVTLKDITEEDTLPEDIKPVVRVATAEDLDKEEKLGEKEIFALQECAKIINRLGLEMKLISAEYNLDGNFVTIYFGAEQRVDFRELVRELSHTLHARVELRQIGPRDEAKMLGGYGRCGREFCCCGFLCYVRCVRIGGKLLICYLCKRRQAIPQQEHPENKSQRKTQERKNSLFHRTPY